MNSNTHTKSFIPRYYIEKVDCHKTRYEGAWWNYTDCVDTYGHWCNDISNIVDFDCEHTSIDDITLGAFILPEKYPIGKMNCVGKPWGFFNCTRKESIL